MIDRDVCFEKGFRMAWNWAKTGGSIFLRALTHTSGLSLLAAFLLIVWGLRSDGRPGKK